MMRRRWRSPGFSRQVFFFMAFASGGSIALMEGVVEPLFLDPLVARLAIGETQAEILLWAASVLFVSLVPGFLMTGMVVRKLRGAAEMAKKLSHGDLRARIAVTGDDGDVFNQLARGFNDMADSLERLVYFEKRLLADISHELRSPLTRMGVAAALLPMQRDSDDFDATMQRLEGEIGHMGTMVGLLLQQGRKRLDNKNGYCRIDLARLISDLTDGYSLIAAVEGKALIVSLDPGMFIWGHAIRTGMIFDNILSNALFHAPKESRILVTGKREGKSAVLSVRDHGAGVPEDRLQDIFRAFFRVDSSRARTSGGAGLGLALARDAAVAMGGDIAARNAGPGLEVTVTLPSMEKGKMQCRDAK